MCGDVLGDGKGRAVGFHCGEFFFFSYHNPGFDDLFHTRLLSIDIHLFYPHQEVTGSVEREGIQLFIYTEASENNHSGQVSINKARTHRTRNPF